MGENLISMVEFIGGGIHTLIIEADDRKAERYARNLKMFPGNTTERVLTAKEALPILKNTRTIEQVCIDGHVFTLYQAIAMLGG